MFKKLLALPLLLLLASSASAAFSFSISPGGNTLTTSAPVKLDVIATSTGGFEVFTITGVAFDYANDSTFVVTTTSLSPTTTVALSGGNDIADINATILPGFASGANDNFRLRITTLEQGVQFTNFVQITAVPEPTSLALIGVVGLGMVAFRRRRA